jgi:hypothetical protein
MKKIAVGDLGEFWYADYKEPFVQLEGAVPGYPQGALVYEPDTLKLLCPYCDGGRSFDNLGRHVGVHGMTAKSYKREVGLPQKAALVSERGRSQRIREGLRAKANGTTMRALSAIKVSGAGTEASKRSFLERGGHQTSEQHNRTGKCAAQILAVAQQLHRERGRVTVAGLQSHGIGRHIVETTFGSHDALVAMVGSRRGKKVAWTRREIIMLLKGAASQVGRTPAASDLRRYGLPDATIIARHFGSYAQACRAAGLDPNLPIPNDDNFDGLALAAYATFGDTHSAADHLHVSHRRVSAVLARWGFPFPLVPFGGGRAANRSDRKAWAADMARRLAA